MRIPTGRAPGWGPSPCRAEAPLTIEKAVSEAVRNNRLIEETALRQRAAVEAEKSTRADLLPKLSTEYGYANFKETPYVVFKTADNKTIALDRKKADAEQEKILKLYQIAADRSANLETAVSREGEEGRKVAGLVFPESDI